MNKAKKIGVLTFHNGPNYGGFMQAWHVVHAVRALGHEACAINYLHPDHVAANEVKLPLTSLSALRSRVHWFLKRFPFRGLGDSLCDDTFTTDVEKVPWSDYRGAVVGSDIVWDFRNPHFGNDPVYFGMHPKQAHMDFVSYAASCGPADVEGEIPDYVRKGISRFRSVGVRDGKTAKLAERSGFESPTLVVDPTWLQDDPVTNWDGVPDQPYVLLYGGGMTADCAEKLAEFCRKKGWKLVTAATPCKAADKVYRTLTPFQWVSLFANATATVVGTLHGTLYSIKYNKPFILMNEPRIRTKIVQVMERTGQGFRVFERGEIKESDFALLTLEGGKLPAIPQDWLKESWDYLNNALHSMKN
ncbi:MAG: polysaccharide pyruvyl transferase family protein [Luteolibacter sp.]